jgi:Spy/CpxP family protein refolding chaperone
MRFKKALLVTGAATTIGLSTMAGAASAAAANSTNDTGENKGIDSLVEKIATRFNLNKDQVQEVFDENREERHKEMQARLEERLDEAVTAGKITSEQKTLILNKLEEMHAYMESLKGKAPEERKELMKQKHDELKQWAEDNDIPTEYLPMGRGHGLVRHKAEAGANQNQ